MKFDDIMDEFKPGDLYCQLVEEKIAALTEEDMWKMAVSLENEVSKECGFTPSETEAYQAWIRAIAYVTFKNLRARNRRFNGIEDFAEGLMCLARDLLTKMVPTHEDIANAYEQAVVNALHYGQFVLH